MPLVEMSPNLGDTESAGTRKRSHDQSNCEDPCGSIHENSKKQNCNVGASKIASMFAKQIAANSSTNATSSPTDVDEDQPSTAPTSLSSSPATPTKKNQTIAPTTSPTPATLTTQTKPPVNDTSSTPTKTPSPKATTTGQKRNRLTVEEKAAQAKQKEGMKLQREAEKKAKADAKADAKAAADARKAEEQKKRQEQKDKADAEKQAKAQERAEKKRQKDEEERKAKEAKEKKAKAQPGIASFFGAKAGAPSTPGKKVTKDTPSSSTPTNGATTKPASPSGQTPVKRPGTPKKSTYDKMFRPFFVKEHVSMAADKFAMDDETKELKTKILDKYITGTRGEVEVKPFNVVQTMHLPAQPRRRGKAHPSVKKLMADFKARETHALSGNTIDLTTDYKSKAKADALRMALRTVPTKFIAFREDSRPPYCGTITSANLSAIKKLARKPTSRGISHLDYDYDSEAEWVDEDVGEDIENMEESDDEIEHDDDWDGFLDDSADAGLARLAYSQDVTPQSTGLCFEDSNQQRSAPKMSEYALELMLPLERKDCIDPFSTRYWPEDSKTVAVQDSTTAVTEPKKEKVKKPKKKKYTRPKGLTDLAFLSTFPDIDLIKIKAGIVKVSHFPPDVAVVGLNIEAPTLMKDQVKCILNAMADRKGPAYKEVSNTWRVKPEFKSLWMPGSAKVVAKNVEGGKERKNERNQEDGTNEDKTEDSSDSDMDAQGDIKMEDVGTT